MTTTNPPRPTPVEEALAQIESSIKDVEHLAAVLEEQLGEVLCAGAPALVQSLPLVIPGFTSPPQPVSPLASRLRAHASTLGSSAARLRNILDRLEI